VYTVISLFSGCGGSSLGYRWAGFKELLAIDFDSHACKVFHLNFPDIPIQQKDIAQISGEDILRFCNLTKGGLDILDGSPPCQDFSIAHQLNVNGERNLLPYEFIRLVGELQPKVFLMENVPGMVAGKMKIKFREIIERMKTLPYKVKCKMMNAANYEVAQNRKRLIFLGVRNDLGLEPSFPMPKRPDMTVGKALEGIVPKTFITGKDWSEYYLHIKPGYCAVKCVPRETLMRYTPRLIRNKKLKKSNFAMRMRLDKPAFTMTATVIHGSSNGIHPTENRLLSIEELKRVCSFPDDFKLTGNFRQQWRVLGNAVMPKFMEALANHIKTNILNRN